MEDKILHFFVSLVTSLGAWGYLILFVLAFLESAAFFGLVTPGETAVLIGGLLAARGVFNLPLVIAAATIGAVLGDSAAYLLGSRYGERFFRKFGRFAFIHKEQLDETRRFFERHGGKTVLIARFTTWLRVMAPVVAGTVHMPYLRFLFFNIYGAVLWVVAYALLGFIIGNSWQVIKEGLGKYGLILLLVGSVLVLGYILTKKKKALLRKKAKETDELLNQHLPRFWGFIKDRFRIGPWYGFSLTAGLLLLILSLATLGQIASSLLNRTFIARLAALAGDFVGRIFNPSLTQAMLTAAEVAGLYLTIATAAGLLALLVWKRRFWLLLVCFLAGLGLVVAVAMQQSLPLPSRREFPNLEAFGAMIVYGLLFYVTWEMARGEIGRIILFSLSAFFLLLIGSSRIYLDAQALPGILAGYVAAFGWLVFSIQLGKTLRQILAEGK